MKFIDFKAALFIVSLVFSFALGTSILAQAPTEPPQLPGQAPAYAAITPPDSVFQIITDPDVHVGNWATNVATWTGMNIGLMFVCGGEVDLDDVFIEKRPCIPPEDQMVMYLENGRFPGGLAALTAAGLDKTMVDPPVAADMALYMEDITDDTIFSSTAYAQNLGNLSQASDYFARTTFKAWTVTRNIALAVIGIFVALAALGVMFRQKLSPQAVVTVYNILPSIPIALVLIMLSYPIVAVANNLMGVFTGLSFNLGFEVLGEFRKAAGLGDSLATGGIVALVADAIGAILGAPVVLSLSLPFLILLIVLLLVLIFVLIAALWQWAKTFATFVVITILMPLVGVVTVLPGKQGVAGVILKKLIANMLTVPIMIFMTLMGLGFITTMFTGSTGASDGPGSGFNFLYAATSIWGGLIKYAIGLGLIFQGLKARSMLEGAFGASGSVMSIMQGGGGDDKKR